MNKGENAHRNGFASISQRSYTQSLFPYLWPFSFKLWTQRGFLRLDTLLCPPNCLMNLRNFNAIWTVNTKRSTAQRLTQAHFFSCSHLHYNWFFLLKICPPQMSPSLRTATGSDAIINLIPPCFLRGCTWIPPTSYPLFGSPKSFSFSCGFRCLWKLIPHTS